jgi:NAD(P)-dependent dehydrogenase (short-subunit alcohol dehydrogenase family)
MGDFEANVLITGASSGIGRATARLFAEKGYQVFGTSRRRFPDKDGVQMLQLDVQSDESVRRCVAEVLHRTGSIDVLINNAGIECIGIAEETPLEVARSVFETNFFGVVRVTNAVLPQMRAHRRGRIINIGSLAAWVGEPAEAFYSASKRALASYTEALRHEVWSFGIHVSLVEPGAFQTDIIQTDTTVEPSIADYDAVRRAAVQTLSSSLAGGRDPRKAAKVILSIARARSPRLRYGAGGEALWLPFLRVLLPQRLFDYFLRQGFGLGRSMRSPHH